MRNNIRSFYRRLDQKYQTGNLQQIEAYLLDEKKRAEAEDPKDSSILLAVNNELGSFYRGIYQYGKSIDAYQDAKKMICGMPDKELQYASILNNMADTYRLMNYNREAIQLFLEAEEIYIRHDMEDSFEYTSLMNNKALVHKELKEYSLAIEALKKSLAQLKKLPECIQEKAITCNNLMALYFALGDRDKAMCYIDCALEDYDLCEQEENIHYAASLNTTGALLFSQGFYQRALDTYHKSQKYTLKYFGENSDYAMTCLNLSWIYKSMNDLPQALAMEEKAYKIYLKLYGADHEKTESLRESISQLKKDIYPFHLA